MFKHTLAAALISLIPTVAAAQNFRPMLMLADCAPSAAIEQFIYQDFGETPFTGGEGIMQRDDALFAGGVWKIYTSPDWSTFTIVIEFPADDVMCLVGMGEDLNTFIDGSQL